MSDIGNFNKSESQELAHKMIKSFEIRTSQTKNRFK